jgi:hypothetical protein
MSITALDAAVSSSRSSSMLALNEFRLVWRWRAGVGGFAASATARAARSAASSFSWQQRFVFLSAAAVARIVASDLDLGHCGRFYQGGETVGIKPYRTC